VTLTIVALVAFLAHVAVWFSLPADRSQSGASDVALPDMALESRAS
jgi:hypothetical protein